MKTEFIMYSPRHGGYFAGTTFTATREEASALHPGTVRMLKQIPSYDGMIFEERGVKQND